LEIEKSKKRGPGRTRNGKERRMVEEKKWTTAEA